MKKTLSLIITASLILLLCVGSFAASGQGYSWYFKPAQGNAQPQIIPEAKSFIDKYDTIYMGDSGSKKVYLTFDAGYENGNVEKILDVLKEKDAPATFFILSYVAEKNTDLVKRMKEEGHLVGNHTKRHNDMSKVTDFEAFKSELEEAEAIMKESTGYELDKLYRPPEGRFSEANLEFADRLGYKTVFWSAAYADWDNNKQMDPARALELVLSRVHNGCVLLLHPTSSTNAEILGSLIDKLREQGYEIAPLTEFEKSESECTEE